jgi:DNA-binding transcriptional ArsR family regulator
MIDPADLHRAVEVLRGMAYEHRLHILMVLRAGEATPATIGTQVPAHSTAIAHHLRHLADAGLIRRRRQGRNVFYALTSGQVGDVIDGVLGLRSAAGSAPAGSAPAGSAPAGSAPLGSSPVGRRGVSRQAE